MVLKIKGYTAEYIKRMAKSIKKAESITHAEALEKASINCGFHSWKNFQNQLKNVASIQRQETVKTLNKDPYRNLIVAAVNELLQQKKINFDVDKEQPGKAGDMDGHFLTKLFGQHCAILWREISYQELIITVWWKYDHSKNPQANLTGNERENFNDTPLADKRHYKKFVGAVVYGWLERLTDNYLMGNDSEHIGKYYVRKGEKIKLEELPFVKPEGYQADGKFYH